MEEEQEEQVIYLSVSSMLTTWRREFLRDVKSERVYEQHNFGFSRLNTSIRACTYSFYLGVSPEIHKFISYCIAPLYFLVGLTGWTVGRGSSSATGAKNLELTAPSPWKVIWVSKFPYKR